MDDETRSQFESVFARLDTIMSRLDLLDAIVSRLDRQDMQLDAIVSRLDEQDAGHDRLMGKVDRLGVLARAGEEAMTSLDALSKRVAKIVAARRGEG